MYVFFRVCQLLLRDENIFDLLYPMLPQFRQVCFEHHGSNRVCQPFIGILHTVADMYSQERRWNHVITVDNREMILLVLEVMNHPKEELYEEDKVGLMQDAIAYFSTIMHWIELNNLLHDRRDLIQHKIYPF